MKRKELRDLFNEISSKCSPVRGIYSVPPTDREQVIKAELKKFREKSLEKKEKEALEKLFFSQADAFHSTKEFKVWFLELKNRYRPESIPDSIYTKLMSISGNEDFTSVSGLIREYLKQTP